VGPGHTVTALYAVRTEPGARGHLATATVRWLDPETRDPHEETGDLEADALHDSLRAAPSRFQVTAVAAYFADALRSRDDLPGAPAGLAELADHARVLSDTTEDGAVRELARAIERAGRQRD
ncbi:VWA domain-containing protein, partial [Streptomyces iakyrus]